MRWPFVLRSTMARAMKLQDDAWSQTHETALRHERQKHAQIIKPAIDRIMDLRIETLLDRGDHVMNLSMSKRGMRELRTSAARDRSYTVETLSGQLAHMIVRALIKGEY